MSEEIKEDVKSYKDEELKKSISVLELRNEIAKQLSTGSKTDDELKKLIPGATYEDIVLALKNMLTLKLVNKDGYPVKYTLSKEIIDKLKSRKEISGSDLNPIRVSIIIESMASDKGALREGMEKIEKLLREDKSYFVYDITLAEIIIQEQTGLFSTYIEGEVSCPDFKSLLRLVYYYGVTAIDVLKPDKLNIPISDLQEALFTIVDMTHGYAEMIYKLKQELGHIKKK